MTSFFSARRLLPPAAACLLAFAAGCAAGPPWTSPNRYRVLLKVDPWHVVRSNSPASVDLDFPSALAGLGETGTFDQDTIEVVAYDRDGKPVAYDVSRPEDERPHLPWRLEPYYGTRRATLHFVLPSHAPRNYAVYFDSVQSSRGKPTRYPGLVGDGDWFMQGCGRREIAASHMDCFCDFDGDGDLDLFKVTVEPFIYCYENVGGNRFADRGRLTSGGDVFVLPHSGFNRSWPVITFDDWDGDGDQDLFVSLNDGPEAGQVLRYENATAPGGPLTLVDRGRLLTASGRRLGSGWFAAVTVVDWDGDGNKDVLVSRTDEDAGVQVDDRLEFCRNIGSERNLQRIALADGVPILAGGAEIRLRAMRAECADLDGDGDLDLVAATQGGPLLWFRNVGTRAAPVLEPGRKLPFCGGGHNGVKVADFDGDGLLDYVVGNLWEAIPEAGRPRIFGRLYKNVGTRTEPKFEERDANGGCPYTERFQACDAARQNTVRAVDWDNDGRTDLIVGTANGLVLWFRNQTDARFPLFAKEELLLSGVGASARVDVCDWDNDGRKDLLVANVRGELKLFLNRGTDARPELDAGTRVAANGKPIDGTSWGSVLVCDWDSDGKKDVILGMGGGDASEYRDWPNRNPNPLEDTGFLFYRNVGTDAAPQLAAPRWIEAGGKAISYTRPNLGSFVDWDGDGKKDFIACEFENNIRLYRNVGPGGPGAEPQFDAPDGVRIVQPWTSAQMISGADAKDWNGDGDLDIVTGQGHGGTGLRFFERDYINDFVNGTLPVVTVRGWERKPEEP